MNIDVDGLILGLGDYPENNNMELCDALIDILIQCAREFIDHPKALKLFGHFVGRLNMKDPSRTKVGFSRDDMRYALNDKYLNGIDEITRVLTSPLFLESSYVENGKTITPKIYKPLLEAGWVEIDGEIDRYVIGIIDTKERLDVFFNLNFYYGSKLGFFNKIGNTKNDGRAMVFYLYLLKHCRNNYWKEIAWKDNKKDKRFCWTWNESFEFLSGLLAFSDNRACRKFTDEVIKPICKKINENSEFEVYVKTVAMNSGSSHKIIGYEIAFCKKANLITSKAVKNVNEAKAAEISDNNIDDDLLCKIKETVSSPILTRLTDLCISNCYKQLRNKLGKSDDDFQAVCRVFNQVLITVELYDEKIKTWNKKHIAKKYALTGKKEDKDVLFGETFIDLIKNILIPHKEEFIILMNCSSGTKYENFIHNYVDENQSEFMKAIDFMAEKGYPVKRISDDELHILLSAYFTACLEPLVHDYDEELIEKYLSTVQEFFMPGWLKIMGLQ